MEGIGEGYSNTQQLTANQALLLVTVTVTRTYRKRKRVHVIVL